MSGPQNIFDSIEENNLNLFKKIYENETFISLNVNPLMLSCYYKSWDIAEYIISVTDFWTNKADEKGNTALTYALNSKKIDFALMLTDYGFTNFNQRNNEGFLAINYMSDENIITKELLERILKKNLRTAEPVVSFQEYNEFNTNLKDMSKGGTYGSLSYDNLSGSVVKLSREHEMIPSLIKEMMFLKMINLINPYITVNLRGVYYSGINFGIVMESLTYSLKDVFILYKDIDVASKFDYFKSIYLSLLECIDKIHNMGILHRDLKPLNVMIDSEGHIRIIDFGLAEYVGIKSKQLKFIGTENYKAPDSGTYNSLRLATGKMNLPSNKRNYSSDIYSFGSIILYSLFNDDFCLYFLDSDIYEYKQISKNKNPIMRKMSQKRVDIINLCSPHLMDFLKNIFNVDSNLRITAKELLLHHLFNDENPITNLENLRSQISLLNKYNKELISEIDSPSFSTDDIRLNRGVLRYGDEIYDFIKEQKIPKSNINDIDLEMINNIWGEYNEKMDDFDVIFNRNIMLTSIDPTLDESIYEIFFKGTYPEMSPMLKETVNKVIDGGLIPLSIESIIEYYITKLQVSRILTSTIMFFKIFAYRKFYEYSLSKRDYDITVDVYMRIIINEVSSEKDIPLPLL